MALSNVIRYISNLIREILFNKGAHKLNKLSNLIK